MSRASLDLNNADLALIQSLLRQLDVVSKGLRDDGDNDLVVSLELRVGIDGVGLVIIGYGMDAEPALLGVLPAADGGEGPPAPSDEGSQTS